MLRRVARVLRVGLAMLGVVFLIALSTTLLFDVRFWLPVSVGPAIGLETKDATLLVFIIPRHIAEHRDEVVLWRRPLVNRGWGFRLHRAYEFDEFSSPFAAFFRDRTDGEAYVFIPLWLLAAVCLAWPVSSFILHRRRQKRGFPVEPRASESGAPKVRQ
jgi:hypothetical protein